MRAVDYDDDDPTPVARRRPHSFANPLHHEVVHIPESTGTDGLSTVSVFKYECTYCGKGFSRPSSLKVKTPTLTVCSKDGVAEALSRPNRFTLTATPARNVRPRPVKTELLMLSPSSIAFTCTIEGCGRTFSVLSNMRRHARVHQAGGVSEDGAEQGSRSSSSRRRDSIVSNASTSTSNSSRRSRSPSLDDTSEAPPGKRLRQ